MKQATPATGAATNQTLKNSIPRKLGNHIAIIYSYDARLSVVVKALFGGESCP